MIKIYTGKFQVLIVTTMLMGALVFHTEVMELNQVNYQKKNLALLLTMKKKALV